MHSGRCVSSAALWVGRLFHATWIGLLAYGISWFALPAFVELYHDGYGPSGRTPIVPEVNPIARVVVGKLMRLSAGPAPGDARPEFNYVLRILTGLLDALYVLIVAGAAAETIASERDRGTWLGLIATPLTGREILRAKVLGTIWKTRGLAILIVGLWAIGLAAGALHPIGFLASLIGLGVSAWFLAVIGVVGSLHSRDRAQATSRILAPIMLILALSGLPFFAPGEATVLLAGFTMPFQTWASLLSHEDVHAATHSGVIAPFVAIGIRDGAGLFLVLATWVIGTMAQGTAAISLMSSAIRGFDAAVGRPIRTQGEHGRA